MKWEMESTSPGSSSGSGWSMEQNKLFENALAIFDKDTSDRWESISNLVPGKSPSEVRKHYEDLVEDVSVIEAGRVALPCYAQSSYTPEWISDESPDLGPSKQPCGARGAGSSARPSEQERKKGVPWTEDEHRQFLRGLNEYGKGDWRSISRNFVISRTPTQVASHAQKYFLRLNSGQKEKKRSSIHDITTVGGEEFRQPPLQQASVITNSSATSAISQSPGLMYTSSMGGAAMVNSLGCPTGDNPLMLPSHSLGPYAQTSLGGFPPRPIISGSSLAMAQMGYSMQPTMHQ